MLAAGSWGYNATPVQEEQATRIYDGISMIVDKVEINTARTTDVPIVVIDDAIAE